MALAPPHRYRMKAVTIVAHRVFKTPDEAAQAASVTARTLVSWCHRYPGLAHKIGGRWRVNPAALNRLLCGLPISEGANDKRAS
jgi:hypothetical protein